MSEGEGLPEEARCCDACHGGIVGSLRIRVTLLKELKAFKTCEKCALHRYSFCCSSFKAKSLTFSEVPVVAQLSEGFLKESTFRAFHISFLSPLPSLLLIPSIVKWYVVYALGRCPGLFLFLHTLESSIS